MRQHNQHSRIHSEGLLSLALALALASSLTCLQFATAVSPDSWVDVEMIPQQPNFSCPLPLQPAPSPFSQPLQTLSMLIQQDCRIDSKSGQVRWIIVCPYFNDAGQPAGSYLYQGTLANLTVVPLNLTAGTQISKIAQPECGDHETIPNGVDNTQQQHGNVVDGLYNKLYFLTNNSTSQFFLIDLVTFKWTQLSPPLPISPLILVQVNHTLLLSGSDDYASNLTLLTFDPFTSEFTLVDHNVTCYVLYDLVYDTSSQTLSAQCGSNLWLLTSIGVTSDKLIAPSNSSTSLTWLATPPMPVDCSNPLVWLRRGQQFFIVCVGANSSQLQNILAFTINDPPPAVVGQDGQTVQLSNPITLLNATTQLNLCLIGPGPNQQSAALKWNENTQTLYVACVSGSAAAISIQATNSTQPIVTSLLSTSICSQAVSLIGLGRSSYSAGVTIVLQCPEGIFTSSGRSLYSIARLQSLSSLINFDSSSQSIFFMTSLTKGDFQRIPTVFGVSGIQMSVLMTSQSCLTLSLAYRSQSGQFLLVCSQSYGITPQPSNIVGTAIFDGQSHLIDLLPTPQVLPQQTTFATSYGFYILIDFSIYFFSPNLLIAPKLVQITSLNILLNTNITNLQIIQLNEYTLIVGITINTTVTNSSQSYYYTILEVFIDDPNNPQNWDVSQTIASTDFPPDPPLSVTFLVDQMRRNVWVMESQNLTSINIDDTNQNSYPVCSGDYNLNAFAIDPDHNRIFAAWSLGDDDLSILGVLHVATGMVTQTVSPATPATSQIVAMLMNPLTGLILLLQGDSQASQIVVYSDQWTCSPGLQWVDGSCQPCGVSTARGFIPYENATRSSPQCLACDVGRFSNISGEAECIQCEAGRYSNTGGAIICNFCAPNSFNNLTGRSSPCAPCPDGTEALRVGSTNCTTCRLGAFAFNGSACETCALDTFAPDVGLPCLSCTDADQQGLQCINGLANVEEGWWAYQLQPGITKFITTQCPPTLCPGGALQQLNTTQELIYCQYPRLNSRDNWLCAECVSDHIPWGSSCEPCSHANAGLLTLVIIIAVLLVIFLLRASSAAGAVTILVFFVQVAALELGPVTKWIDWIQFANFGTSSTRSCLLPISPVVQNILTMAMPLMLFVILGITCCVNYFLSIYFSLYGISQANRVVRALDGLTRGFSIDRYIGCMMAILIFCYTSVTVTCVKSLHCVNVAPNVDRLFSAPSIACSSDEYKTLLFPVTLFFLIVYVIGFPLIMFVFLWRSSPMLKKLSASGDDSLSADAIRFTARWSHFYRPYRNEIWFWQPIAMFRRFVFSLISVLLIQSPASRYAMYGAFGLMSLVLHTSLRPFIHTRWNHLESVSYLLLLYIAYLLSSQTPPFVVSVEVALFLLVVPFSSILVGLTVRTIWFNLRSKQRGRKLSLNRSPFEASGKDDESTKLPISAFLHSLSDPLLDQEQP